MKGSRSSATLASAGLVLAACVASPPDQRLPADSGHVEAASGPGPAAPREPPAPPRAAVTASSAPKAAGAVAVPPPPVPRGPGPFSPSEMTLASDARPTGAAIASVSDCATCHPDVTAQWRASAHGFGSLNNPIYRVAFERFRAEQGPEKSRHCAGCHDMALLVDGEIDKPALAIGARAPAPPRDDRARVGISCAVCHGIEEARPDGNGSYTLGARPVVVPRRGDPESLRRHKETVALAPLRAAALCGACHRSFLGEGTGHPHYLPGPDEVTAWSRSAWAGSLLARVDEELPEKDCRGCHMPREAAPRDAAAKEGKVASHRFAGANTWIAAMRDDREQLAREVEKLRGAASVDVAAVVHPRTGERSLPADGAPVGAGEELVLDVVVANLRAGHHFPGGVVDAQDTWIEVTVDDARGRRIAEAGTQHEETGADPTAHVLRAAAVGEGGEPFHAREVGRFRAAVYRHTVAPRDAAVVQLGFEAPASLEGALPLRITARLRHRSRTIGMARAACEAFGKAYAGAGAGVDPCARPPVTDVAERVVLIGEGAERSAEPSWRRLLAHGLGLMHAVQERIGEARPSLEKALAEVEAVGSPRERAMVAWALGWLSAHEGRTDEALRWADRAEALAPGHPALDALRGEALSLVWRWAEAVPPLDRAARAAPRDDAAWTRLAVALGSRGGDPGATIAAAGRGLALSPRDPDLLRVEAMARRALGDPGAAVMEAAYDRFRPADVIPAIKSRCSMTSPACALERNPVHVHRMRRPP